ncbi:MAG: hypothetical protein C4315_10905 [Chloroflexota bacterium]
MGRWSWSWAGWSSGRAVGALVDLSLNSVAYPGRAPVLADLSLSLRPGEVVGILGPTESGKTTLAYVLAGLIPGAVPGAASGQLVVGGRTWGLGRPLDRREWLRQVGLALAEPYYQLSGAADTVAEEVGLPLENLGLGPAAVKAEVGGLLQSLGLGPFADRSPFELSVGQQQRVVLGATLVPRPKVLVLDDAFEHLDGPGRAALKQFLARAKAEGRAAVLLSGRRRHLEGLVDRLLWLEGGRLHPSPQTPELSAPNPKPGREPGSVVLEAEDLWAGYSVGRPVLAGLSLRVRAGEALAIVGPNGAGKSTLLLVLLGLLRPWAGRVRVFGSDAGREPPWRLARLIGYLPQNPADALFGPTVWDDVAFGPRNLGVPAGEVRRRTGAWLSAVGLGDRAGRHPLELSPGWRRLVALASALALGTPILALDEPTVGLDDGLYGRLVGLLEGLKEAGRTLLLVSQDLEFVGRVADRVVFLAGGRLVGEDSARAVLSETPPAEGRPPPGSPPGPL